MPTWQLDSGAGRERSGAVSAANAFEAADLGDPGYAFCRRTTRPGAAEDGCRELPDVSANADEFTGGITIFIGHSAAGTTSGAPRRRRRCGPRCSRR